MFARILGSVTFVVCVGICTQGLRADEPGVAVIRQPIGFKDLTPPALPESHGEKHTTCLPEAEAHGGLFFTAEYLLLRPRRAAFDFAITDANRDLVPSGTLQSLNYELRSGVRGGVGYRFCDHWDAQFVYTYFESGADRSISIPAMTGTIYATLTRAGLNDEVTSADANGGLEYNVFDTLAGRTIHFDEHTIFRLVAGFRFATIRQSFNCIYNGGDANLGQVLTQSNFDGFGPLLGAEVAWDFCCGWHLYGRGHASLVTGTLKSPISETNNAGLTLYSNLDASARKVIPVIGLAIGGGWQHDHVSIRAGYEITNWFGMIDTPRFTGELSEGKFTTRTGDLSLEGLFAQICFSY